MSLWTALFGNEPEISYKSDIIGTAIEDTLNDPFAIFSRIWNVKKSRKYVQTNTLILNDENKIIALYTVNNKDINNKPFWDMDKQPILDAAKQANGTKIIIAQSMPNGNLLIDDKMKEDIEALAVLADAQKIKLLDFRLISKLFSSSVSTSHEAWKASQSRPSKVPHYGGTGCTM